MMEGVDARPRAGAEPKLNPPIAKRGALARRPTRAPRNSEIEKGSSGHSRTSVNRLGVVARALAGTSKLGGSDVTNLGPSLFLTHSRWRDGCSSPNLRTRVKQMAQFPDPLLRAGMMRPVGGAAALVIAQQPRLPRLQRHTIQQPDNRLLGASVAIDRNMSEGLRVDDFVRDEKNPSKLYVGFAPRRQ